MMAVINVFLLAELPLHIKIKCLCNYLYMTNYKLQLALCSFHHDFIESFFMFPSFVSIEQI